MAKRAYIGVNNFEPVDLPSGYTQVEYIQSSGTQYINTGYNPNNNTRIVCKVSGYPATNTNQTLYGSRSGVGSSDGFMFLTTSQNCYRTDFDGTTSSYAASVSISGNLIIDKNKNITTLNGANKNTISGSAFTSTYPIYIFAANNGGTADFHTSGVKLYYLMIYDNDVLTRHFIPCKNVSGTVGLYDLVNDVFYGNTGTGTFTAGTSIISGVARRAKRMYIGVDGISRKIKKGYIGVNDVAHVFFAPELQYVTEVVSSTQTWICPMGTTSVTLRLFGGGAGGHYRDSGGGGGGHMAYDTVAVVPGTSYKITIGSGGGNGGGSGGITSFGSLLSASGGYGAGSYGGSGGSGGGGGDIQGNGNGGDGSYGGGGGAACKYVDTIHYGGSGGTYGGAGGNSGQSGRSGVGSSGGSYSDTAGGGGGGYFGDGGHGAYYGGGGGGYQADGGNASGRGAGGGGGYGVNGKGGDSEKDGGIAAGGGGGIGSKGGYGGKGICIMSYWKEVE